MAGDCHKQKDNDGDVSWVPPFADIKCTLCVSCLESLLSPDIHWSCLTSGLQTGPAPVSHISVTLSAPHSLPFLSINVWILTLHAGAEWNMHFAHHLAPISGPYPGGWVLDQLYNPPQLCKGLLFQAANPAFISKLSGASPQFPWCVFIGPHFKSIDPPPNLSWVWACISSALCSCSFEHWACIISMQPSAWCLSCMLWQSCSLTLGFFLERHMGYELSHSVLKNEF